MLPFKMLIVSDGFKSVIFAISNYSKFFFFFFFTFSAPILSVIAKNNICIALKFYKMFVTSTTLPNLYENP